jgi:hypothetical protein
MRTDTIMAIMGGWAKGDRALSQGPRSRGGAPPDPIRAGNVQAPKNGAAAEPIGLAEQMKPW